MTQLTLDFDPEVIKQVERLAAESAATVSATLERLVREKVRQPVPAEPGPLTRQISGIIDLPADIQEDQNVKLGPLTRRASGLVKFPSGIDDDEVLTDALMAKYGFNP